MVSVGRYKAVLKEVAADLKIEADSELCQHVATLRLLREGVQARILRGERVAVDDVLTLDQALKAYLPERKAPRIQVSFVEGVRGIYNCQHCGKENELKEGEYTPPSRPKAPPQTSDAPAANAPLPDAAVAPADSAAPAARPMPKANKAAALDTRPAPHQTANVTPLVTYRDDVSGSKFHSAVINGREVPPLKRLQPDHWRTTDQAQAPHPYVGREVAHPLPPVPRTDPR
jgi:hypothetical protein